MLKKTFPVIVVLIALSVIGVIYIQISWLKNLMVIQQERYTDRAGEAAYNVKEEISRQTFASVGKRLPGMRRWMPDELGMLVMPAPSAASRFTTAEIGKKIRKALDDQHMEDFTFEFAVSSPSESTIVPGITSRNFLQAWKDTANNRNIIIPIVPESAADLPVLPANEFLYISITDFFATVRASLIWMMIGSGAFTIIVIAAFFLTVKTIIEQRNLSKIKNDFVNNMTHELKTPLATISLAVDALQNNKVIGNPEKSHYFSDIIKQENKRMNKHVETILQAALMDKHDMKLNLVPLHAHEVIQKVVNTFTLQLDEKGGVAELNLNARTDLIKADETHFTNLINNLVDNAVKYSKENLKLTITTHCTTKYLVIQVQDNGIGMSKESVKRIFEKFYRAHTGNVHNVKGFGLGMSYVKSVIDAHNGRIRVDSVQGKGSTFTLEVPLNKES